MDSKLMVPPKFAGTQQDAYPWRTWAKKARRFVGRTHEALDKAMQQAEKATECITDVSNYQIT